MMNLSLLTPLERIYMRCGVLRAYFKLRKMDYMQLCIFGDIK